MDCGQRSIDPNDIALPPDFAAEAYITNLTTPIDMEFAEDGSLYIGDAGIISGGGKIIRCHRGMAEVVASGFEPPLTGITLHKGKIYAAHRGSVTAVDPDGTKTDIIEGLPSLGDHHNNKVVFGPDGRMYFGQGTATNSGVPGPDNDWVKKSPFFHDFPAEEIVLAGQNFRSENMLSHARCDDTFTGAYSPYGVAASPGEVIKGIERANGSILSVNEDGSDLTTVAWGFRNPFRIRFDRKKRLFVANHGMDVRGSRPVANATDEIYIVKPGCWYGWPDYSGGLPVTMPQFKPEGKPQPEFILAEHPMIPPKPLAVFTPHSALTGFDFNYGYEFPGYGNIYIAEFGSEAPETTGGKPLPYVGHRVSMAALDTGRILAFAVNKSGMAASETGGGGLERPTCALFGPDGALYVADFGVESKGNARGYMPHTGLIWRICKR
jgi:glucose/arabinose dehydrogenase